MRSTLEVLDWYKQHDSYPQNLGFDPDGMCLKICRTARGLPAVYPSALSAQEATPAEHRVRSVKDLKRGMVLYFDDPKDSSPYGHIVTMIGRVKDADESNLHDIIVRTNSVKSNRIVLVRGDYFKRFWGDEFQFGATWLNGQAFPEFQKDQPTPKPQEPKPVLGKAPTLHHALKDLEKSIAYHEKKGNDRLVRGLTRDRNRLKRRIERFS